MNVLSLFDGMSCGQIALERAGFKVDKYYASEVDKFAIKVTQSNYPDTIQLGDVRDVSELFVSDIDLLIGGSPCQGFSFAGKQLNFDDERSKLFFEFVRILEELKPKYFLLENVKMKKEYQDVITKYLGVEPIEINSALVSAQNRKRLYWANIPNVEQPEDKGILLKDVLETGEKVGRVVGRKINPETGKRDDYNSGLTTEQRFEPRPDNKSGCLTTVQKDNMVFLSEGATERFKRYGVKFVTSETEKARCLTAREYVKNGKQGNYLDIREKSKCVRSSGRESYDRHEWGSVDKNHIRKLTPVECERLQTVPDNYTNYVSNTQRYKMLGNGWTVDVIAHIFKNMEF